jgi:hypothetical protein
MTNILRKCRICGIEAKTDNELKIFILQKNSRYGRENICRKCKTNYQLIWEKKNINKQNHNKNRRKIRTVIISLYGGKCNCCGEKTFDFLTIDHIHGGGKKERKQYKDYYYYYKSIEQQFYDDKYTALKKYQVLCMNCNIGKHINGICPHKDKNYNKNILI